MYVQFCFPTLQVADWAIKNSNVVDRAEPAQCIRAVMFLSLCPKINHFHSAFPAAPRLDRINPNALCL